MAKDPYRYFRIEAQELVAEIGTGLLDLEKSLDPQLTERLLRQAHTLKGASRIVDQGDIGDRAHRIEDLLTPFRGADGTAPRETIDEAVRQIEHIGRQVAALPSGRGAAAETTSRDVLRPPRERDAIRVAVHDLDAVLESTSEARIAASALRRYAERLTELRSVARQLVADLGLDQVAQGDRALRAERLVESLDAAERDVVAQADRVLGELSELHRMAAELRLVPAQSLVTDLKLVVRDAQRTTGKEVTFEASGTETHLDAHVLAGLRKALVHLVRNCVAHGIEPSEQRRMGNKPPAGRISVAFARRGQRVSICCSDDGQGIDVAAVRRVAVQRRLVDAETAEEMDEQALGRLLLRGGLTTSASVSSISGRGIGLAAVRHAVEALKGEVELASHAGEGTRVEILVPVSLSSLPALSVRLAEIELLLPWDSVVQVLRLEPHDLSRDATGEQLAVAGTVVPFVPLRRLLHGGVGARQGDDKPAVLSAVVLQSEGRRAAIGVDRVGGSRSVVVHSVPERAAAESVIGGATFDDRGRPLLVLAPSALVAAAAAPLPPGPQPTVRAALPLLVVDDSLTTRMLEQSILESAGYQVDLAVSAEDALAKARERTYALFIVDVEMPGMDGFEFISAARAEAALRDTPAILVTSRSDPDDRKRGKQVGARAYFVKSEFDQAKLLKTVRGLVG